MQINHSFKSIFNFKTTEAFRIVANVLANLVRDSQNVLADSERLGAFKYLVERD